jgi:hypothetical protein
LRPDPTAVGSGPGRRIGGVGTVCALGVALVLLAASLASAGRPLTTEDAETLMPGQVELELAVDYVRGDGTDFFLLPGGPALNAGLLPRLEGTLATAVAVVDAPGTSTHAGLSDTIVRLKYRGVDEGDAGPALMMAVAARLPTGDADRGLGSEDVDVQALAVAGKTVGPVTLFFNAGYTFVTRDRSLDVVNLNLSAQGEVARAWSLVGEIVSEVAVNGGIGDRAVLRGGVVYAPSPRVKLDAAAGVGLTRASPDVLLTIGVTIGFE